MPDPAAHTMQCLEVWGGNQAVDNGVVMPGLDAWVYSRPFGDHAAGGDIHYVSSCVSGRITRLLVADVSGHGDTVAGVARKLRGLMRRYLNYIDQAKLVQGVNREFAALTEDGGFATAVVGTFFAPTNRLTLCNAGHPPPLWWCARRREWSVIDSSRDRTVEGLANIPLGIAELTRYDQTGLTLAEGDLVVAYTDSLSEARDAGGRMLGTEGLLAIARTLDPTDPGSLIRTLLAEVERYAQGPPADDATVLILRPNALRPRISIIAGMKSSARMVREFLARLGTGLADYPWPESRVTNMLGIFFQRFNRARRDGP